MTRVMTRAGLSAPGATVALCLGAIVIPAYLLTLSWYMQRSAYEVWGGLLLAPVLIAAPVPLVLRAIRRDPDSQMRRVLVGALWVKLAGTVLRYYVADFVYGTSDAASYHSRGALIATAFRQGEFDVALGSGSAGTRFIQNVTGWVYTVIGPNKIGGFIVFSWLSFLGLYLFYRAFRLAAPRSDHRRYALLVFFLPSLAYWPSSIGKEAWMVLGLGVCAYGGARVLATQRGGFVFIGMGLVATAMIRPHVTLLVVVSILAAYLLRPAGTRASPVAKIVGVAVVLGATFIVLSEAKGYFGLDAFNADAAGTVLDEAQDRTAQGGSAFAGERVRSPADLPQAAITVLFRPLPFEAHNAQSALAALEGVILAGICLWSLPRLRRLPRELIRTPYLAFCLTFTVLFVIAFSSLNNFGILARERAQMFPLLLALLCSRLPDSDGRALSGAPGWSARFRTVRTP